jgi:hypothetical protein
MLPFQESIYTHGWGDRELLKFGLLLPYGGSMELGLWMIGARRRGSLHPAHECLLWSFCHDLDARGLTAGTISRCDE